MIEVGVRELKSRLSYYLQLIQAGETIAVKVRDRVVGFFSQQRPSSLKAPRKKPSVDMARLIDQWKREGFLLSGGRYRHIRHRMVRLKGDKTMSDIVRELRDEDY